MVPQEYKPLNKTEEFELMSLVNKIQNYTGSIIYRNGNNIKLESTSAVGTECKERLSI